MLPDYSQRAFFSVLNGLATEAEKETFYLPDMQHWSGSCFGFALTQAHYLKSGRQDEFSNLMYDLMHYNQLSFVAKKQIKQNALEMSATIEQIHRLQYRKKLPALLENIFEENAPSFQSKSSFVGRAQDLEEILTVFFKEYDSLLLFSHKHVVSIIQVDSTPKLEKFVLMGPNNCLTPVPGGARYHTPIGLKILCRSLLKENFAHIDDDQHLDLRLSTIDSREGSSLFKKFKKFYPKEANLTTQKNTSSLWASCATGLREYVDFFLNIRKEDCNQAVISGATPLHAACEFGHLEVARLLLKQGAKHNPCNSGSTPLFIASYHGYSQIAQLLLAKGANHNSQNDGATPLFIASQNGHIQTVIVLLRNGATHAARKNGCTPIEIAQSYGHSAVIALLKKHKQTGRASFFTPAYKRTQPAKRSRDCLDEPPPPRRSLRRKGIPPPSIESSPKKART